MEELREDVIERMLIKGELKFIDEVRVNFSKQADEIVEKAKKGVKLKYIDYFILTTTDQDKIDKAIIFEDLKERIATGRATHKDVDFLINTLGNVGKFDQTMRKAFYRRVDESNLQYAQTHKDEFTEEEIQERIKKVKEHQSMEEILKDNLL